MSCPTCGDYRDDGICPVCTSLGYEELDCGCIETPWGTRNACSEAHALCDGCGAEPRQAGTTFCGSCLIDQEQDTTITTPREMRR